MENSINNEKTGVLYAALAYFMWGILPLYWKLLDHITAGEILAHRIFWSFVFMILLLGIFLFHETFTKTHFYSFSFIWAALIIFSFSKTKQMESLQNKWMNRNSLRI
jgi:EamA domain-containing membrane protein RarD